MKYSILALALLGVGCKVDIKPPVTTTVPAKAATPAAAPATTTTASTGSTAPTVANPKPSDKPAVKTASDIPDEQKPGFNKSRIYQLFNLKTVPLDINGQKLQVWVADDDNLRQEGLMFVKDGDIKPDQGMIFVFASATPQNFWMKHTIIPLDIAYIGADKKVVSTATMKPLDEKQTPSHAPAQYALEMKVGTLQRLGIQKGTVIGIPASVKAQDAPPPGMGGPGMGGPRPPGP